MKFSGADNYKTQIAKVRMPHALPLPVGPDLLIVTCQPFPSVGEFATTKKESRVVPAPVVPIIVQPPPVASLPAGHCMEAKAIN